MEHGPTMTSRRCLGSVPRTMETASSRADSTVSLDLAVYGLSALEAKAVPAFAQSTWGISC